MTGKLSSVCVTVIFSLMAYGPARSAAAPPVSPIPLIFDTDMGNDIDAALALALIHTFERRGECRLLAVTLTKDNPYAAPFVDLVNTFCGHGDIPIGVVRGGVTQGEGNYLRQLACAEDNGKLRYPHRLRDGGEAIRPAACVSATPFL